MITLLRKIRKRLISQGNFSSYLLYAIGEIALVVIGILIALQINNWNEARKNKIAEQTILKDLYQEFQLNQSLIVGRKERLEVAVTENGAYMEKLAGGTQSFEEMRTYHLKMRTSIVYAQPSLGVINSILSSGELKLVQNDSLKYLLTDWKDRLGAFTEAERSHGHFHTKFGEYLSTKLPQNFYNEVLIDFYDLPKKELEKLYFDLTKETNYRSLVIRNKGFMEMVLWRLEESLAACERILDLLEKEP